MEPLANEILEDLTTELGLTEESDLAVLSSKIRNAYREVKRARNYQSGHTQEFIDRDMENFYSNIRELALYDFNQVGAEGQVSSVENGISRTYKSRRECLDGVFAYISVF